MAQWLKAPTSDSSQPPVTPALRDPMSLAATGNGIYTDTKLERTYFFPSEERDVRNVNYL